MQRRNDEILSETLCFHAQQAAEKALKAALVYFLIEPPKTHSIGMLAEMLPEGINVPPFINEAKGLTDYAVSARYPGELEEITEHELNTAIQLADSVFGWAKKLVYTQAE